MSYKSQFPDIASRLKYCVTPDAVLEYVKIELQNAYDHGFQAGFVEGRCFQLDQQIGDMDNRISEHEEFLK